MGMYTGLRFKGIVKEKYRDMIEDIMTRSGEWGDYEEEYPFLKGFTELPRHGMIPFGSLSYMPDSWEDASVETEGFHHQFNHKTGYWAFQCSLKNYDDEIDEFLVAVMPEIIEELHHAEYLYEEWDSSVLYKLVDGKIHDAGRKSYREEFDDLYGWIPEEE